MDIHYFSHVAKNLDCGYSLELPHRGGSNEYPQSMFCAKYEKYMYQNIFFEKACFRNG